MQDKGMITELPLGLVELDDAGTVLYYKRDAAAPADPPAQEIVGRNFFTDVAPVADAAEFRDALAAFRHAHTPSHSFDFTFNSGDAGLPTRVLLARIHEKSEWGGRDSLLVHIRKVS